MLARTPITPIKSTPKPRRLNRDGQAAIRDKIAVIMHEAEPTPFAAEGPCRAGIRSALCLQGWRWRAADDVAAEIVEAALRGVGAIRPTWKQGQPEWTQDGVMAVQHEYCRNCFKLLPDGHFKFCCEPCRSAYRERTHARWQDEHRVAQERAARAARIERRDTRPCERCGTLFKPKQARQTFCGVHCAQASKRELERSAG